MNGTELIGLAASISLMAGWRIYLCIFVTGLAMRMGWIALPHHLAALDALANPWVLGIAAFGLLAEFFVDKIAWLDSIWDALHTLARPVGGALLAMAIVDADDPAWQIASLLLGGSAALLGHGAKAGIRAAINASPEPFSNIAASSGEDFVTAVLLALAIAYPAIAIVIAIVLATVAIAMIVVLIRLLRRLKRPKTG